MRVEQFRRVAGDSGFLLRLFECGRAREVLVDRMLPARRAGQRQTCTDVESSMALAVNTTSYTAGSAPANASVRARARSVAAVLADDGALSA